MYTIFDIPHELQSKIIGSDPKFKPISVKYDSRIMGLWKCELNFNIEYIDSFINLTISISASQYKNNIKYLQKRIDEFIDQLNKGIPSTLDPKYYFPSGGWGTDSPDFNSQEIPDDYVDIKEPINKNKENKLDNQDNHFYVCNKWYGKSLETIIKYTGQNYKIGNIILSKNAYGCVIDMLNYIKKAVIIPENVE